MSGVRWMAGVLCLLWADGVTAQREPRIEPLPPSLAGEVRKLVPDSEEAPAAATPGGGGGEAGSGEAIPGRAPSAAATVETYQDAATAGEPAATAATVALAAANPAAVSISLGALLERARKDPPAVLTARATLARTRADLDYIDGQWLPIFLANGSYGYAYDNRLVLPDAPRINSESLEARASLSLEWELLNLARGSRSDSAEATMRAAARGLQSAEQNAMLAAAELFFLAQGAQELVQDAALSLERRTQQQQATEALVQAGTRSPVDAQRAAIEVTSARYGLELRRSEERAAQAALAAALGRPPTEAVRPARMGRGLLPPAVSPGEAQALARRHHPELPMAEAQLAAAESAHEAAVRDRLPTLGVAATGSVSYLDVRRGAGIDGHQFGGVVNVFVRYRGLDPTQWLRGDAAAAAVLEAKESYRAQAHRIGAAAVAAYHSLERAQVEQRRAVAVLEVAERAREAQNGRYLAGLSSLLELLDAEDVEQQARLRRIEARRDESIAVARLLAACGTLGKQAVSRGPAP